MDGFLTKPLDSARLREVLQQYLQRDEDAAVGSTPVATIEQTSSPKNTAVEADASSDALLMDWPRFEAMLAGDHEFAQQLLKVFIGSAEQILTELRASAQATDRTQLKRAAHKLKGASANICAEILRAHCESLELAVAEAGAAPGDINELIDRIAAANARTRLEMQRYMAALSSR